MFTSVLCWLVLTSVLNPPGTSSPFLWNSLSCLSPPLIFLPDYSSCRFLSSMSLTLTPSCFLARLGPLMCAVSQSGLNNVLFNRLNQFVFFSWRLVSSSEFFGLVMLPALSRHAECLIYRRLLKNRLSLSIFASDNFYELIRSHISLWDCGTLLRFSGVIR